MHLFFFKYVEYIMFEGDWLQLLRFAPMEGEGGGRGRRARTAGVALGDARPAERGIPSSKRGSPARAEGRGEGGQVTREGSGALYAWVFLEGGS